MQDGLLEVQLLKPWSYEEHKYYPAEFKAAARTFLLCATKGVAPPTWQGRCTNSPEHAPLRQDQTYAAGEGFILCLPGMAQGTFEF